MPDNNKTSLRDELEQLTTEQLDDLLNGELEKETPDGDKVRLILSILWEREKELPVQLTPKAENAWNTYKARTARLDAAEKRAVKLRRWGLRVASMAMILFCLLCAVPQKAEADSLFDKLARLTDSIIEFFSPGLENDNLIDYEFVTSNPGLQQVYDAVVELGVTDPVVPSWLPEGYELVECKPDITSKKTNLSASFESDGSEIVFSIDIYDVDISHEYHWNETTVNIYEHFGNKYTLMQNNGRWVVVWFTDKAECFVTLDCQEDTLYRILDSICVMEEKQ